MSRDGDDHGRHRPTATPSTRRSARRCSATTDVFLMGEEVGVYQGAYKVSRGLLDEFGAMRVVDTPITELGFAGVGVGAAMVGLRPVIEFMTWNFALLAIDQLVNSAAKMRYMSGGQFSVPDRSSAARAAPRCSSARSTRRRSRAGYAHIPGLKVVTPATPADAKGLLKSAIRDDNPVVFLEGEMLYNIKGEVPDGEHLVPLGKADVKREGERRHDHLPRQDGRASRCKAAEQLAEEGIDAEVVDLRTIRPLDIETILASVAKTNRCVVVEEGWPFAGVGAQVVDTIQREAFDELDAPVLRVTGPTSRCRTTRTWSGRPSPTRPRSSRRSSKCLYLE